ncbi:MAG: penicillin-binding transpeptidase domain-containing protein [Oscillospiraceae bacterium]|nr:penicillin-binding transpeptidase domain-containing protein [Oscillospiraceae bacterium]
MKLPTFQKNSLLPGDGKLDKLNFLIRFTVLIGLLLVFGFLGVAELMKIQIVDGAYYADLTQSNSTAVQTIQASRGQIFDSAGNPLNTNKIVYKVIVQRAFFPFGEENEVIEQTLAVLRSHGESWFDSLPISHSEPFEFLDVGESALDNFKERIGVNLEATVENCVQALHENYKISREYTPETARAIAGVRYEMELRDFSQINRFTLSEDISFDTLVNLMERSDVLRGIDIIEEPMRIYLDGIVAAHIRGTIGPISAEEFAELRNQGYSLNDTIGKFGVESAMESILRGENGTRTIERNMRGVAVSDEVTTAARPGNSVMLTIDSRFQKDLQDILDNHISWLRTLDQTYSNERLNRRGIDTEGGAVAVIEVKTGRVIGLATSPTYDINDYLTDYDSLLNAELSPLVNRATAGRYRPGSSFKTITSAAGLNNNVIDRNSTVTCRGVYTFFDDFRPYCHNRGGCGTLNVVNGLRLSCNIFYYDVGRRTGIDALAEAAEAFGVGTNLGLEIASATGRMTTPEIYEELLGSGFTQGITVQAAIGQSETLMTPLHLAVAAATFGNSGYRYRPYLVDSVWNYDLSELIYRTEPQVVAEYATDRPDVYSVVKEGMIAVSSNIYWPPSDSRFSHFAFLDGNTAACKTGTAQIGEDKYNSVFMGYYPADDPIIAFGVVLENSEFSRYILRNIIDAYFYDAYEPDINEDGLIASPWKRWDDAKAQRLTGGA